MKFSILFPALYENMAMRMINSAAQTGGDYEIVVVSPKEISGKNVVWVEDVEMAGCNKALRKAFEKSNGDVVFPMNDGVMLCDNWHPKLTAYFNSEPETVWGLSTPAGRCAVFGRYYPFYPAATRAVVRKHWECFFPYSSGWGDVAFGLGVQLGGTPCKETPEHFIIEAPDRMGNPEAATKSSHFDPSLRMFLSDFKDAYIEWGVSNWRQFNHGI